MSLSTENTGTRWLPEPLFVNISSVVSIYTREVTKLVSTVAFIGLQLAGAEPGSLTNS